MVDCQVTYASRHTSFSIIKAGMAGTPQRETRNINEGWLTYSDGRRVPVYWQCNMHGSPARITAWSEAYYEFRCTRDDANAANRTRWRKEMELTVDLLAKCADRIRVLVVKGGSGKDRNDQVDCREFRLDGEELVMIDRLDKTKGVAVDRWLLELQPEPSA
jgi:hypothetical protein